MSFRVLATGATGFIGGRLAVSLDAGGFEARCLVGDRGPAEPARSNVTGFSCMWGTQCARGRFGAARGIDAAYYLIHSIGRGGPKVFVPTERAAALALAGMARAEGIERVVYVGGLGDEAHSARSRHLRSPHETARLLRKQGPAPAYLRAGMVVGPESGVYGTLRYLVERLPAMIAPAWLQNPTQPIAIDDPPGYLVEALRSRNRAAETSRSAVPTC